MEVERTGGGEERVCDKIVLKKNKNLGTNLDSDKWQESFRINLTL